MSAAAPAKPPASFPAAIPMAVKAAVLEFFNGSCKLGATEQAAAPTTGPSTGIMGVISFFGDPVWSFALVLPEGVAGAATTGFAGFDIPFDSPDMGDMVGEMANVMAGDIVARLETARVKAQMSLPTVARGQDVELLPPAHAHEMRLHFAAPAGSFQVRLFQAVVGAPPGYNPGK